MASTTRSDTFVLVLALHRRSAALSSSRRLDGRTSEWILLDNFGIEISKPNDALQPLIFWGRLIVSVRSSWPPHLDAQSLVRARYRC